MHEKMSFMQIITWQQCINTYNVLIKILDNLENLLRDDREYIRGVLDEYRKLIRVRLLIWLTTSLIKIIIFISNIFRIEYISLVEVLRQVISDVERLRRNINTVTWDLIYNKIAMVKHKVLNLLVHMSFNPRKFQHIDNLTSVLRGSVETLSISTKDRKKDEVLRQLYNIYSYLDVLGKELD